MINRNLGNKCVSLLEKPAHLGRVKSYLLVKKLMEHIYSNKLRIFLQ